MFEFCFEIFFNVNTMFYEQASIKYPPSRLFYLYMTHFFTCHWHDVIMRHSFLDSYEIKHISKWCLQTASSSNKVQINTVSQPALCCWFFLKKVPADLSTKEEDFRCWHMQKPATSQAYLRCVVSREEGIRSIFWESKQKL